MDSDLVIYDIKLNRGGFWLATGINISGKLYSVGDNISIYVSNENRITKSKNYTTEYARLDAVTIHDNVVKLLVTWYYQRENVSKIKNESECKLDGWKELYLSNITDLIPPLSVIQQQKIYHFTEAEKISKSDVSVTELLIDKQKFLYYRCSYDGNKTLSLLSKQIIPTMIHSWEKWFNGIKKTMI